MIWKKAKAPRWIDYNIVGTNLPIRAAFFEGEIWLTQKQLAEILQVKLATINEHIKKIVGSKQFPASDYCRKFEIEANDGKKYGVSHYRMEILETIQSKSRK